MAIKSMIALCLAFAVAVQAAPEPEPEADAYYGYYGRSGRSPYYGSRYYGGYRSYSRPSYYYKRPSAYYNRPAPVPAPAPYYESAPLVVSKPAPAEFKRIAPAPAAAFAPAPAPAPALAPLQAAVYEEKPVLKAFNAVPAVPAEHVETYVAPSPAPAPVAAPEQPYYAPVAAPEQPYNAPVVAPAPQPIAPAAPVFNAAPVAHAVDGVIASQYHAQDEFGNVNYGYSNPNSQKTEQRDAYGNVMGSYSYNDGTGYPKHVSYVADNFGFRITAANNLPVAPVA